MVSFLTLAEQFPSSSTSYSKTPITTSLGRAYFEPGWSREKCVKPIAKTETCQAPHTTYVTSGKLRVRMDDGSKEKFGPGDVGYVPLDTMPGL